MSRQKIPGAKLTQVAIPTELLAWEREALAVLRSLSIEGREMMVSTCIKFARRQNERKSVRPSLRLIEGGKHESR